MSASQGMDTRICQDISQFRHFSVDTNCYKYTIPASLPQRPAKFNNLGRECPLTLNTFNVLQSPSTIVHQYDVSSTASMTLTGRYLPLSRLHGVQAPIAPSVSSSRRSGIPRLSRLPSVSRPPCGSTMATSLLGKSTLHCAFVDSF
jgi:hypothetical protein